MRSVNAGISLKKVGCADGKDRMVHERQMVLNGKRKRLLMQSVGCVWAGVGREVAHFEPQKARDPTCVGHDLVLQLR